MRKWRKKEPVATCIDEVKAEVYRPGLADGHICSVPFGLLPFHLMGELNPKDVCNGFVGNKVNKFSCRRCPRFEPFVITSKNRRDFIKPGDYIVKYKSGFKFPFNPVLFELLYEAVGD